MSDDMQLATLEGLRQLGLVDASESVQMTPLTGGVASDIWHVRTGTREFAVKRALAKLRVAADWQVPVSRNACEVAWLSKAGAAFPGAAPRILAHDPTLGFFAMEYLAAESHPVWKRELRDGRADPAFAEKVGMSLVAIHASTALQPELARDFNDDALFRAIRIEPYLEFTAQRHPEVGDQLRQLGAGTLTTHLALVHGDVSPKNILVGPAGPVFLDAECAWYGDPAFDLAFCLNHLLLKCLWTPAATPGFLASFDALSAAYLRGVTWEASTALDARTAALLPALLLARIDGKSPVEYITDDPTRDFVRAFAVPLIQNPISTVAAVRTAWESALRRRTTA